MITQVSERHDGDTATVDDVVIADAAPVRRARDETLPADVAGSLAAIFAALGEPTRLRIVHALSSGELCVGDLAAMLGMAVPAVSQHLRVLRDLRIVRNRRVGKMVYYALDDAHVADLFAVALAHVRGGTS
jgi:ArsR family transcriptional regulator, lead/cadmium/zinc/bismuth-responsive transcriptional repressor